jgi:hypothetical protein
MVSGVRFRAYPTAKQKAVLRVWIGHQRFVYNAKVREAEYFNTFARHSLALTGCQPLPDQAYSQFVSDDTSFLKDVPSQLLRNGAYRYANGCARMLKGLGGAPAIRKKHGRQSVLVTSELFDWVEHIVPETGEVSRHLVLGTKTRPFGRLHFKAHRAFELPKMLSVSVEPDGRWFVSFCFEAPALAANEEPYQPSGHIQGVCAFDVAPQPRELGNPPGPKSWDAQVLSSAGEPMPGSGSVGSSAAWVALTPVTAWRLARLLAVVTGLALPVAQRLRAPLRRLRTDSPRKIVCRSFSSAFVRRRLGPDASPSSKRSRSRFVGCSS